MDKQKKRTTMLCSSFFCLILLGVMVAEIHASEGQLVLMRRSSEVLKFNAADNTSIDLTTENGMLRKVGANKTAINQDVDKQKANNPGNEQPETSKGLTVSSQYIKAENLYRLVIADTNGGGVIVSDQNLEEAPADGYQASAECSLPVQSKAYEAKKYVYLKTKTDDGKGLGQYSRLELDMTIGKAKLIVDMDSVTNPDGSKNLRYNKKAQQKVITQRLKEIEKAMKEKTVTSEQTEEMQELMMLQAQGAQDNNRWDFEGNHERIMQQKRQRLLEADGRLRPKKRTINSTKAEPSS